MESLAAPSCLPCLCLLDDHVELAHAIRTYAVALVLDRILYVAAEDACRRILFDNLSVHGLMTIQNRTTDLLVHIITYNIDIKHNSCSEFLCVIVIIIPSSPFSFKRYLLEYVRKCVFYDQVCD